MSVEEFAKYVVDNLYRATISNSLAIVKRLYDVNPKEHTAIYNVDEFLDALDSYIGKALEQNTIKHSVGIKLLASVYSCREALNSDKKYQKLMILDNLIIEMWEITVSSQ